jgi:hypothetical protein
MLDKAAGVNGVVNRSRFTVRLKVSGGRLGGFVSHSAVRHGPEPRAKPSRANSLRDEPCLDTRMRHDTAPAATG